MSGWGPKTGSGGTVANIKTQILEAPDRVENITWADFGTRNERITRVTYTSATVYPGTTLVKTLTYSFIGHKYQLDTITWSLV